MKKNLIFLTLLISVLMVSVVSAGITGYLVKRGIQTEVASIGTVSVTSVDGDVATFTVTDSNTGATEILSGAEGQIITTSSGAYVEIQKVTEGTWFTRGTLEADFIPPVGGELGCSDSDGGLNIYEQGSGKDSFGETGRDSCTDDGKQVREIACNKEGNLYSQEIDCPNGCSNGACIGEPTEQTGHKHLIVNIDDISYKTISKFSRDSANNKVFVEIPCPFGQAAVDAGFNLVFKDKVLSTDRLPVIEDLIHDWFNNKNSYAAISFFDPDKVINLEQSIAYVYCAKTEEAVDASTAHFPIY